MIRAIYLFLIFLFLGVSAKAQVNVLLNGTVLDTLTLQPIANKPVEIFLPSDFLTINVTTDQNGEFNTQLDSITPGGGLIVSIFNCQGSKITFLDTVPMQSGTIFGTYLVCDTVFQCNVSFGYQATGLQVQFQSIVSPPNNPGSLYDWQFGDGSSSQTPNPLHQYAAPGDYFVCLSYQDSFGCSLTFCDTVNLHPDSTGLRISGTALLNGQTQSNMEVRLYRETAGGAFLEEQLIPAASGSYTFYGLQPGNYLVQGFLPSSVQNPPTYWQNGFYWDDGSTLFLTQNQDQVNIDLLLPAGTAPGPARILGSVMDQNNLPLPSALVGLEDSLGELVEFVEPDQNGAFEFNSLPYGLYWLGVDYPGIPTVRKAVRLNTSKEADTANFKIDQGWLISALEDLEMIRVYPNPAVSELIIEGWQLSPEREIKLYNALGKIWEFESARTRDGTLVRFPTQIPPGSYFLSLREKDRSRVLKILILDQP